MLSNEVAARTEWMTVKETAAYTGYSEWAIRNAAKSGELEATRRHTAKGLAPFRIARAAADAWLRPEDGAARTA